MKIWTRELTSGYVICVFPHLATDEVCATSPSNEGQRGEMHVGEPLSGSSAGENRQESRQLEGSHCNSGFNKHHSDSVWETFPTLLCFVPRLMKVIYSVIIREYFMNIFSSTAAKTSKTNDFCVQSKWPQAATHKTRIHYIPTSICCTIETRQMQTLISLFFVTAVFRFSAVTHQLLRLFCPLPSNTPLFFSGVWGL